MPTACQSFIGNSYSLLVINTHGTLLDLKTYFDSDPEIDQEEYFSQIISAYSVDGKLPTIPMSVM